MAATLWAWAVPAWFSDSPLDHTWVTDFDNRVTSYPTIGDVIAAGRNNWYCWGSYHAKGGTPELADGFLGSQSADAGLAGCLVASNLPSKGNPAAQGTIFSYGVDGVCHQLANQVLWATKNGAGSPLTVRQARGYRISSFLFGTYGRQTVAWRAKIASCSGTAAGGPESLVMHIADITPDDEFAARAREVLGAGDPDGKLTRLLALRGAAAQTADALRLRVASEAMVAPSAAELNAHHNDILQEAAQILSVDEFRELFGIEPGQRFDLVDPDMLERGPERR